MRAQKRTDQAKSQDHFRTKIVKWKKWRARVRRGRETVSPPRKSWGRPKSDQKYLQFTKSRQGVHMSDKSYWAVAPEFGARCENVREDRKAPKNVIERTRWETKSVSNIFSKVQIKSSKTANMVRNFRPRWFKLKPIWNGKWNWAKVELLPRPAVRLSTCSPFGQNWKLPSECKPAKKINTVRGRRLQWKLRRWSEEKSAKHDLVAKPSKSIPPRAEACLGRIEVSISCITF